MTEANVMAGTLTVKGDEVVLTASRVYKHLPGLWIEFEDENGKGYAQPDHLVVGPQDILIFECKLSWTPLASEELQTLYAPLVSELFSGKRLYLIEAFQHPNGFIGETVHYFEEIWQAGNSRVLQWQAR